MQKPSALVSSPTSSMLYAMLMSLIRRKGVSNALKATGTFQAAAQTAGGYWKDLLAAFNFQEGLKKFPVRSATDVLTRTGYMAFRSSGLSAPLGVMVPVQGKADLTSGDVLSYGRGTQVSGVNFDCANTYQGSTIVLYEPLYVGNDSKMHFISRYGGFNALYKGSDNRVYAVAQVSESRYAAVANASALLTRHLLMGRQDADNPVSGSAYYDLWLNNTQTLGPTSPGTPTATDGTIYRGSNNGANADHLMLCACDVEYVLSTAELTALYNSGAYADPARVLAHPELIKAYWNPGARAATGNMSGVVTAEGCFVNHRPYNASTNPNGDLLATHGMFETVANIAAWTPTNGVLVRAGAARSFNGSSQYLRNGSGNVTLGTTDITVTFWAYGTSAFTGSVPLSLGDATAGHPGIIFAPQAGNYLYARLHDGTTLKTIQSANGSLGINAWYHCTLTADRDGNAQLHIQASASGAAVNISTASAAINSDAGTSVGAAGTSYKFAGRIARVKVWKSLLTAAQVTSDYNSGKGLYYAECTGAGNIPPAPDYAWDLDEASGNAPADAGGITLTDTGYCGTASGPDVADLAGLFDTGAGKLIATVAANVSAAYTITGLSAGDSAYFSGFGKYGSVSARLRVYSGVDGAMTTQLCLSDFITGAATKASAAVQVQTGHNSLTVQLIGSAAVAGQSAFFDNVRMWKNLVTNGDMEGTYTKTGSALHASTAATTTYTSTRATDATAWTLTNAMVGMIAEAADGKYGFITAVGANYVDVDAWVGGTPANGQVCSVYSAIAPGWSTVGSPRLYRATGRSGRYAQGVVGSDGSNYPRCAATVTSGQWYALFGWIKGASANNNGRLGTTSLIQGSYTDLVGGSGSFTLTCAIGRATSSSVAVFTGGQSISHGYIVDDVVLLPLSPIDFTATPASDADSQDQYGYRHDGGDTNTIPSVGNLPAPAVLYSETGLSSRDDLRLSLLDGSAFADGAAMGRALAAIAAAGYNLSDCLFEFSDGTYYALAAGGVQGTGETCSSNALATFDFTDGTWITVNATIIDANSFSTTGSGGIYKSGLLSGGKLMKAGYEKSSTATAARMSDSAVDVHYVAAGQTTGYGTVDSHVNLYLNQTSAGTTDVTLLNLQSTLTPSANGCTLRNAFAGGGAQNIWSKHASFTGVGTLSLKVFHKSVLQGSIAIKFVPRGWNGADGREHVLFDHFNGYPRVVLSKTTGNKLQVEVQDTAGVTLVSQLAVTAATLPAESIAAVGIRWNAGALNISLGGSDGALVGVGSGIFNVLRTPLYIGSSYTGASKLDGEIVKMLTFNKDIGAAAMTSLLARL